MCIRDRACRAGDGARTGGRSAAGAGRRGRGTRSGGPRLPRFGRRFVLRPLRGSRLGFGIPGMRRSVPLQDSLLLPFLSKVNPRGGTVRLLSARRRGSRRPQTGTFQGSSFLVKQARRSNGLTVLTLRGGDFGVCAGVARNGEASAAGSRRVRRLFGRGRGRFRTRGRNSAATVRGTVWTMEDRCDGTLTRVRSGTVRVRDFGLRRTVIVRAGESYLAKAR